MPETSPIRPTDDAARTLARGLMTKARFGALGVPSDGAPMVTRVAVGVIGASPVILVSDLSAHTSALKISPVASLLVGEPGPRGDPLTHPRLTLQVRAAPAEKPACREAWLAFHPKSALYIDFADFLFFRLDVMEAHLNGGFGKAYRLTPEDLASGAP